MAYCKVDLDLGPTNPLVTYLNTEGCFSLASTVEANQMPDSTLPTRQVVRTLPANITAADCKFFKKATATLPAAKVRLIDSVEAPGRGPLRRHGEYLPESFFADSEAVKWRKNRGHWRAAAERLVSPVRTLDSPAVWITDNWSCGYYHWMIEALGRLEFASRGCDLSTATLVLQHKYRRHRFMVDSLKPFGLLDVRFLKRFERIHCREVYFPERVASTGHHDEHILADMRSRYLRHLNLQSIDDHPNVPGDPPSGNRVYISRRRAAFRKIRNEQEIMPVLRNHGFEEFIAENHDLDTQLSVSAQAGYIVSNHGGGLANIFMMKPGGRVLEMRADRGYSPNCFFNLAGAAQLPFYYMRCNLLKRTKTAQRSDLKVDPAELDRVLHRMTTDNISQAEPKAA